MDVPEDCDISDFEGEEGDSVNIADLGLLKMSPLLYWSGFGCRSCMNCLGRSAAFWLSWQHHRQNNIF